LEALFLPKTEDHKQTTMKNRHYLPTLALLVVFYVLIAYNACNDKTGNNLEANPQKTEVQNPSISKSLDQGSTEKEEEINL